MAISQKLFEIENKKDTVFIDDFKRILMDFDDGDRCVLDFSKMQEFAPPPEPFKVVLEAMILKSSNLILLGPECFEPIVNGINNKKFHFILKPYTAGANSTATTWEEIIKNISKDFFEHYYEINQTSDECKIDSYAVASIDIQDNGKEYEFGLVMDEQSLYNAIDKVLLINKDPSFGDCKDLAAEILNMICGHIREHLRTMRLDIKLGVPKLKLIKFKFPPNEGTYWAFHDSENQMGLFLKEVNHVCA